MIGVQIPASYQLAEIGGFFPADLKVAPSMAWISPSEPSIHRNTIFPSMEALCNAEFRTFLVILKFLEIVLQSSVIRPE